MGQLTVKMQENLFNKILENQQKGQAFESIILELSKEDQNTARELIKISSLLLSAKKNIVPSPERKHKYARVSEKAQISFFHFSRFAAGSISLALLISVFTVGGYKAMASLPGQPLFKVKRTAENVRLKFVVDKKAKAQLQLLMAQKRLKEARVVLNNPDSNKKQEIAALTELAGQTKTAVESVQELTINQPLEKESHPMVSELETLANEQKQVIKQIKTEDEEIKVAAVDATNQAGNAALQAVEIKKYLAIAEAGQEPETLVELSNDPNMVSVFGILQELGQGSIVVEKTSFLINQNTEIKNLQSKKIGIQDLKIDMRVKVIGKKDQEKIVAQSITLFNLSDIPGEIKGSSTSSPENSTTTPVNQVHTTTPSSLINQDTKEAASLQKSRVGSFLIEDPSPQYNP